MLHLAGATVAVLVVQTLSGWWRPISSVSSGPKRWPVAGVALVFPVLMVMQMTSNGGMWSTSAGERPSPGAIPHRPSRQRPRWSAN
jgi:hypothetical protein